MTLLVSLGARTPLAWIIAAQLVIGLGFALFSSPNTNAVMGSVEKSVYVVASATLGTVRLVGQMLSMGFTLIILKLHVGSVRLTPDAYPRFLTGSRVAFSLFAALCAAGVFASLARGRETKTAH